MRRIIIILALSLYGCELPSPPEVTDCSVREPSRDDPTWSCVKASSFEGACIPAASFTTWRCLELDASATLCEDAEPFRMTVYLSTSGVSLDCRDRKIDHAYSKGDAPKRPAFRTPYARSVSDISLAGCRVSDIGGYGVDLKRFFRGDELEGPMTGHRRISVDRFAIADTGQIGIYVGQNSEDVRITATSVERAFMGIYLEAGTRRTLIRRALIQDSREREGIAIDSSQENVIEDSVFAFNAYGHAINLYKNCGEVSGQVCPIRRALSASKNVLRANVFVGDSVNVAWRQGRVYGVGHCIDIGWPGGFYTDHATENEIVGNHFLDGARLIVRDEPNTVEGNHFETGPLSTPEAGAGGAPPR
jgi:hypothetical protein